MERTSAPNAPLHTIRDGMLKATVWENEGKNGTFHSVTLSKLYEGEDRQLKETQSFSPGDLLKLAELSRDAHRMIRDRRRDLSREWDAEPLVERDRPDQSDRHDPRPPRFRDFPEPGR